MARLYESPLVTISAIDGSCPAGGTGVSMCCDYRIATTTVTMGLNEVQLGISVPAVWMKLMATLIGQGKTDKLTQFGVMVDAREGIAVFV
jgi:3,2-trans-enoyl-CoA isomerase